MKVVKISITTIEQTIVFMIITSTTKTSMHIDTHNMYNIIWKMTIEYFFGDENDKYDTIVNTITNTAIMCNLYSTIHDNSEDKTIHKLQPKIN